MEKSYRNIAWYFSVVALVIFIGFYPSYFRLFPRFEGLKWLHHYHAFVMLSWLALLIVQPILIRNKQFAIHRGLGKFSYFLIPFVITSMFLVYRNQYFRMEAAGQPHKDCLASLFMPFTDILPFTIYYILGIYYRKNTPRHMRYMIATSLVIIGSGLVRIFFRYLGLDGLTSFNSSNMIIVLMFIGFVLYDRYKKKKFKYSPFLIAGIIYVIPSVLFFFIPKTVAWQLIAEKMIHILP